MDKETKQMVMLGFIALALCCLIFGLIQTNKACVSECNEKIREIQENYTFIPESANIGSDKQGIEIEVPEVS